MGKIKVKGVIVDDLVVVILIMVVVIILAGSCVAIDKRDFSNSVNVIDVQGMTCIVYRKYKDSAGGGITCNWSEWDGGLDE